MLGLVFGVVLGVVAKILYDSFRQQELPESAGDVQRRAAALLEETREILQEVRHEIGTAAQSARAQIEQATGVGGDRPASKPAGTAEPAAPPPAGSAAPATPSAASASATPSPTSGATGSELSSSGPEDLTLRDAPRLPDAPGPRRGGQGRPAARQTDGAQQPAAPTETPAVNTPETKSTPNM